jgi:hypothetical protein
VVANTPTFSRETANFSEMFAGPGLAQHGAMSSCLLRRLAWLLSLLVLFVAACTSDPAPQSSGPVLEHDVSLSLDQKKLEVLGAVPATTTPPIRHAEHWLAWELVQNGKPVKAGEVPDARFVRSEWDASKQAKPITAKAAFASFQIRLPAVPGEIVLYEPDKSGRKEIGRVAYVPPVATPGKVASPLLQPGDVLGTTAIVNHGSPRLNIAIMSEGYREHELGQFQADADAMVTGLGNDPSYAPFWNQINVWRIDVRSVDSGIDDPAAGIERNTAFDTGYGTNTRRCIWFNTGAGAAAARNLADSVGAHMAVVLVNSAEYGGCAATGMMTTVRDNANVLAHELGHAAFGLADEYEEASNCSGTASAPNVSASFELQSLPWRDLVNTDQLPTPDSAGPNVIGAFEGAAYCSTGMYRSQHDCMMRSLGPQMCAACSRAMQGFFNGTPVGGGGGGGGGSGGSGGEGAFAGQGGCTGEGCVPTSCGNGVCQAGVEDSYTCPPDCPPVCGNGVCDYTETHADCPSECEASCGDNECAPGLEDSYSCLSDCPAVCGNGNCDYGETCTECADECSCLPGCGNGVCDPTESSFTCLGDCPPVCGNGTCDNGETQASCPGECGASCGDGYCSPGVEGWTTCPGDCPPVCGNGTCDGESCWACPGDCGACPAACGNGSCEASESCSSCAQDCGPCAPGCGNGSCSGGETCSTCAVDCGACPVACGNGQCSGGETCTTCAVDCGPCPPTCGNGQCSGGENCSSCQQDCGPCSSGCGDGVCAPYVEDSYNCLTDCPPVCPNGACDYGETNQQCPSDCGPQCGDGYCTPSAEDSYSCLTDCPPVCGNGACDNGETCDCASDCGPCPTCGDNQCEDDEICWCIQDCGYCPP